MTSEQTSSCCLHLVAFAAVHLQQYGMTVATLTASTHTSFSSRQPQPVQQHTVIYFTHACLTADCANDTQSCSWYSTIAEDFINS